MQEKKRGANTQRQVLKQLKLVSMQEKKAWKLYILKQQ